MKLTGIKVHMVDSWGSALIDWAYFVTPRSIEEVAVATQPIPSDLPGDEFPTGGKIGSRKAVTISPSFNGWCVDREETHTYRHSSNEDKFRVRRIHRQEGDYFFSA